MPQMKLDSRNYSEPRKCDAPVANFATFEIGDESPPDSNSPFNGFFRSGQRSKNDVSVDINNGRRNDGDKAIHSNLSELSNHCNQVNEISNCDLGLPPTDLLIENPFNCVIVNEENQNDYDTKETLFSDCLLNSLTDNTLKVKNMRIINDSDSVIAGDFSDLLSSISLPEQATKRSSPNSNSCLANIEVANLRGLSLELLKSSSKDNFKHSHSEPQNNGTLSDILSSISLENNNTTENDNTALSDILSSISFEKNNTTENELKSSSLLSSDFCLCLDDIKVPTLNGFNSAFSKLSSNTSDDISKLNDSESRDNASLSDILSSISFHENDTSTQNRLKSLSLSSSDSSLCLENITSPTLKEPSNDFLNLDSSNDAYEKRFCKSQAENDTAHLLSSVSIKNSILTPNKHNESNLSSESSMCLNDINFFSEVCEKKNDNVSSAENFDLSSLLNDVCNSNTRNTTVVEYPNNSKTVPTSNISVPKPTNNAKCSINDSKHVEFSFFSVSPDNIFSNMLSNFNESAGPQKHVDDGDSANISMLDLLKSVNVDSNGSLSEYLSISSDSSEENAIDKHVAGAVHGDSSDIFDIDLSSCVKTNEDASNKLCAEPPVQDYVNTDIICPPQPELKSFMKVSFDLFHSKRPRMNSNQSLFAKALSCKPKRKADILQKVASIKSDLSKHYFNRPFPNENEIGKDCGKKKDNTDTKKEMVICKSNYCVTLNEFGSNTLNGHRNCTPRGLLEVQ